MITYRLYLDTRKPGKDGLCNLYLVLSKQGKTAMTSLNVRLSPEQWKDDKVVKHPNQKRLNCILTAKKGDVSRAILDLSFNGAFVNKTARESLDILLDYLNPERAEERLEEQRRKETEAKSVAKYFSSFINKIENSGTRDLYLATYNKMLQYCEEEGIDFAHLTFDDVDQAWLDAFEKYCLTTQKQNTASRHLRDIRAVFNAAIDDGLTTKYPFRKFKIKVEESRDKSFTADKLRELFNHNCYPGGEQEAVDMFLLMFLLIGINTVDLAYLTEIRNGRIDYTRRKTHKHYSVKIEPEAKRIIDKYQGEEHLLNILERVPNYKTYFNRMGKTLRKTGKKRVNGKRSTGHAILPDVCFGSARTSWATIAQEELDIDREVIAAALGHHTVDVTTTYLRTRWRKKVDEANRKVIDWVLYKKK